MSSKCTNLFDSIKCLNKRSNFVCLEKSKCKEVWLNLGIIILWNMPIMKCQGPAIYLHYKCYICQVYNMQLSHMEWKSLCWKRQFIKSVFAITVYYCILIRIYWSLESITLYYCILIRSYRSLDSRMIKHHTLNNRKFQWQILSRLLTLFLTVGQWGWWSSWVEHGIGEAQ